MHPAAEVLRERRPGRLGAEPGRRAGDVEPDRAAGVQPGAHRAQARFGVGGEQHTRLVDDGVPAVADHPGAVEADRPRGGGIHPLDREHADGAHEGDGRVPGTVGR